MEGVPLLDHILVSKFDIDLGSTLLLEYPKPTGTDEFFLAEMMLPDGAQKRDEDWTVFLLNRKGIEPPSSRPPRPLEGYYYQALGDDWKQLSEETVLLCPSSALHEIFIKDKSSLLLNTISFHEELECRQIEPMFTAFIGNDGFTYGLRFNNLADEKRFQRWFNRIAPDPALETRKARTAVMLRSGSRLQIRPAAVNSPAPLLYVYNRVATVHNQAFRRGAETYAMAFCSRHQYIQVFKPLLLLGLDNLLKDSANMLDIVSELFDSVCALDINAMPQYSLPCKMSLRENPNADLSVKEFQTSTTYRGTKLKLHFPLAMMDDEVGEYPIHPVLRRFSTSLHVIYNALLSYRRILFLGYDLPSEEIVNVVFGAIAMVSPPLTDFLQRVYPVINLSYTAFTSVKGYVAGVTNPMFRENPAWWDVLCDLNTGKVAVSPLLAETEPLVFSLLNGKISAADAKFFSSITADTGAGQHHSDGYLRARFSEYTTHNLAMAMDEEEFADEEDRRTALAASKLRIDVFRITPLHTSFLESRQAQIMESALSREVNVPRMIRRLRVQRNVPTENLLALYAAISQSLTGEAQLLELMSLMPHYEGGLYPLAVGLLHADARCRQAAARLLSTIEKMPSPHGAIALRGLNAFLLTAFERLKQQQPAACGPALG